MAITNKLQLQQEEMIAGDYKTMEFECYEKDGVTLIDISHGSARVVFTFLGDDYTILTKTGSIYGTNGFTIVLENADTLNWQEGYYIFQPIVVDGFGKEYHMAEGRIYIKSAIK